MAPLGPLATPEEVAKAARGRLAVGDDLADAITELSKDIRRVCGWHISPVLETTVRLDHSGGGFIRLPTLRLVSIRSVKIRGQAHDPQHWEYSDNGYLELPFGLRPRPGYGIIEATFTHGFTPDEVSFSGLLAALLIKSRLPIGVTGASTGAVSRQFGSGGQMGLAVSPGDYGLLESYMLERRS